MSAVERALTEARARISPRVKAQDLAREIAAGALLIDTRPENLRRASGHLPGAVILERNCLEWRLDPSDANHPPEMRSPDQKVIESPLMV